MSTLWKLVIIVMRRRLTAAHIISSYNYRKQFKKKMFQEVGTVGSNSCPSSLNFNVCNAISVCCVREWYRNHLTS